VARFEVFQPRPAPTLAWFTCNLGERHVRPPRCEGPGMREEGSSASHALLCPERSHAPVRVHKPASLSAESVPASADFTIRTLAPRSPKSIFGDLARKQRRAIALDRSPQASF